MLQRPLEFARSFPGFTHSENTSVNRPKRRNSNEIAAFAKSRLLLARFLRPLTDALSRHLAPSAIARPEICRQTHPCHSSFPNPQASFTPLHGQRQVTTRHMKRRPPASGRNPDYAGGAIQGNRQHSPCNSVLEQIVELLDHQPVLARQGWDSPEAISSIRGLEVLLHKA